MPYLKLNKAVCCVSVVQTEEISWSTLYNLNDYHKNVKHLLNMFLNFDKNTE